MKTAKREIAEIGCVLRHDDGEYRVNVRGVRDEACAYYTNCIEDAYGTAWMMRVAAAGIEPEPYEPGSDAHERAAERRQMGIQS